MLLHALLPSQRLKRLKSMLSRYNYREHQKDSKFQIAIEINVREAINQTKECTYSILIGYAYVTKPSMKTIIAVNLHIESVDLYDILCYQA